MSIVSTSGLEDEGELRKLRRRSLAQVLARYISQTAERPAVLVDIPVVKGAAPAVREQLVVGAIKAVQGLSPSRLVASADKLTLKIDDLLPSLLESGGTAHWPEGVLSSHRDVIGGSRGARVRFARTDAGDDIEVFTTRPDTLFGLSFVAVSPSHAAALSADPARIEEFRAECNKVGDDPNAKAGAPLGLSVRHPFLPERTVPVWLANFVVEGYGTGAAGGCPACDQRDLDFAHRYGLAVLPIICPPGESAAAFQVGATAHSGDGTMINSSFLDGLSVQEAIDAAIGRLVEVGRGEPALQYRLRSLVVAEASADVGEVYHSGRAWRFTESFLAAAALISSAATTTWQPHTLHVTTPELATRHMLDARILWRALAQMLDSPNAEPWEEMVLVGNVKGSIPRGMADSQRHSEALSIALLADTPPDREVEWSDNRYAAALRLVEAAYKSLISDGRAGAVDRAFVADKLAKLSNTLSNALRRRRINLAIAALHETIAAVTAAAEPGGLDASAKVLVASLLYSPLPDLAAKVLAAAGQPSASAPAWPHIAASLDGDVLIEVIVQINGKKRGVVRVPRDADEKTAIAAIRSDDALNGCLGGKPIRKTVVVPNRLVNLVV